MRQVRGAGGTHYFTDEDCELEGVAQHTFNARTGRELSFGKGDTIRLRAQVVYCTQS